MTEAMMDVGSIRFTQEHVYDSFNANSAKAGGVVELIEAILSGKKTPRDLPLIRVAPKRGAYWCVDNRRLFVYKHCQLGEIPVEVYGWKDMREFELKWRNGLATRSQTSEGRRVGVIQRTDVPFPRSPIAEKTLSKIRVLLSPAEQRSHDASIEALRRRRKREAKSLAAGVAGGDDKKAAAASLLRSLVGRLAPSLASGKTYDSREGMEEPKGGAAALLATDSTTPGRKKKGKRRKSDDVNPTVVVAAEGETFGRGHAKRKKRRGGREAGEGAGDITGDAGPKAAAGAPDSATPAASAPLASGRARKKLKTGKEGRGRPPGASASPPAVAAAPVASTAAAAPGGPVRLTVALAQEDSGDEAYDVELTAL